MMSVTFLQQIRLFYRREFVAAALLVAGLMLAGPQVVLAAYPQTAADFAQLPPYCKWKMMGDKNSPTRQKWARKLKGGFIHIHHYCAAMHSMRLANAPSIKLADKIYLLKSAKGDLLYMVDKAPKDFVLNPEISLRLQNVLMQLNSAKMQRRNKRKY